MTCRDIESLILAERDGALSPADRAALSDHVAACESCRNFRTEVSRAVTAFRSGVGEVRVPDVDEAWRDLRRELRAPARRTPKRPLAPILWFGAPFAAAAALAVALFIGRPTPAPLAMPASAVTATVARSSPPPPPPPPPPPAEAAPTPVTPAHLSLPYDPSIIAGADYVEPGDPNASTLIYVDKDSGWLVVWTTEVDAPLG